MDPLMLPHEAVNVMFTGVAPAATPPISAVKDNGVFPPEVRLLLPVMLESVMAAAENAKSVASLTDAPDAVALTVKVAAPAAEPVTEVIPTVAIPVVGSLRAVAEVSVASAELRLKLTSLLPTGAPVPSFKTALAL
jgi:hypothetical protein